MTGKSGKNTRQDNEIGKEPMVKGYLSFYLTFFEEVELIYPASW